MFGNQTQQVLKKYKIDQLWMRLDYIRAPRKRMNFIPLSSQRAAKASHTLWSRGIDDASVGTGLHWRFCNRRTNA